MTTIPIFSLQNYFSGDLKRNYPHINLKSKEIKKKKYFSETEPNRFF